MKIALGVEYRGDNYYGFQKQNNMPTVQNELEQAISTVANEPVSLFCAGRTDAGVHCLHQVVHFETKALRGLENWRLGINANLPNDIAVHWVQIVDEHFHARYSATARRYKYFINNSFNKSVFSENLTWHIPKELDHNAMHQAGQLLLGENDFSSFRASQCQSLSPNRNIHFINVFRQNQQIVIEIQANAFLHHMVRNIISALVVIGKGQKSIEWIDKLLQAKDRTIAPATAPAKGLFLVDVIYPKEFNLPSTLEISPFFIS